MNNYIKKFSFFFLVFALAAGTSLAQDQQKPEDKEAEYTKAITQRADKIVVTLGITDQAKANRVRDIIVQQYRNLNSVQAERDEQVKKIKEQAGDDKLALEAKVKDLDAAADIKVGKYHTEYLSKLSKEINPAQIEKIKDGMTYNVLPVTYKGYLEMLPDLTEKQKSQILAYLTEAREHAIDAGSSEKKHWWFGKYKGRINNYLSAEGVETKKAREEWEKKLKEEQGGK